MSTVTSDTTITQRSAPHLRWNATVLGADMAIFSIGIAFASRETLIPAFAERLGAPNILIGAIPALMTLGWMLPGLLAANHAEGLPRKLPFIVKYTTLERVSYPLLGLAGIFLAPNYPGLTIWVLLALLLLMSGAGGWLMPAWLDLIGKLIPVNYRGRFFAYSTSAASLLSLLGAGGLSWLLSNYGFPLGYAYCFLAGSVFIWISFAFLAIAREEPSIVHGERPSMSSYLQRIPGIVSANPNLRRFLISRALVTTGQMSTGFYSVYALRELGAADVQIGIFTTILLASQTVGTLIFGWIADHRGHITVLAIGALASCLGSAAAFAGSITGIVEPSFAFMGLGIAATNVSALAIGMEFGPETERPTYVAISNGAIAPFAFISPLIGGLIADYFSFSLLFAIAMTIALAGTIMMTIGVRDPRSAHAV